MYVLGKLPRVTPVLRRTKILTPNSDHLPIIGKTETEEINDGAKKCHVRFKNTSVRSGCKLFWVSKRMGASHRSDISVVVKCYPFICSRP